MPFIVWSSSKISVARRFPRHLQVSNDWKGHFCVVAWPPSKFPSPHVTDTQRFENSAHCLLPSSLIAKVCLLCRGMSQAAEELTARSEQQSRCQQEEGSGNHFLSVQKQKPLGHFGHLWGQCLPRNYKAAKLDNNLEGRDPTYQRWVHWTTQNSESSLKKNRAPNNSTIFFDYGQIFARCKASTSSLGFSNCREALSGLYTIKLTFSFDEEWADESWHERVAFLVDTRRLRRQIRPLSNQIAKVLSHVLFVRH